MVKQKLKQTFQDNVDARLRDSLWALRSRRDSAMLSVVARHMLRVRYPAGTGQEHLEATMAWLCAAQDATDDDGVSAFYDVRAGTWAPSYPETTGYIIPTFYDYARYSGDVTYRRRAERMADWLLTLELADGAFPIGPLWPEWERTPIIFDTGQIIQGLVRAFDETGRTTYLFAAQRAGDWLAAAQDDDGCWRHFTSLGYVHTYNVRVAWALLQLFRAGQQEQHHRAAMANLEWALTQQDPDGWFRQAAFRPDEDPLTHTIAYTIEGLLESGLLLSDERLVSAAQRAADALVDRQAQDGFLRARYGSGWRSNEPWSCLTGNAQMAIIWLRLYQHNGDERFLRAAAEANHFLKRTQRRHARLAGVAGGIAGSFPIYDEYEPYRYLNWAAKFFADSLLLEDCAASPSDRVARELLVSANGG
jgi:uncharacterized protein YyaL (SSP411 family)